MSATSKSVVLVSSESESLAPLVLTTDTAGAPAESTGMAAAVVVEAAEAAEAASSAERLRRSDTSGFTQACREWEQREKGKGCYQTAAREDKDRGWVSNGVLLVAGVTWLGAMKSSKLFRKTDMSQSAFSSRFLASLILITGSTC